MFGNNIAQLRSRDKRYNKSIIMPQKIFNRITGIIFIIVAALHLLRSILGWDAILNDWNIPIGVSVVAFLIAAFLAYSAFGFDKAEKTER